MEQASVTNRLSPSFFAINQLIERLICCLFGQHKIGSDPRVTLHFLPLTAIASLSGFPLQTHVLRKCQTPSTHILS
jgi:hypothetical protein